MIGTHPKPRLSRREFVRNSMRHVALGVVVVIATLLARPSKNGSGTSSCLRRRLCSGCGEFLRCDLPQAQWTRRSKTRA